MINTSFLTETKDCAAIVMRHADRNRIISGVNDDEPLNELGLANSVEFGKRLRRYDRIKIFTSPVGRCVQTGEAILQGAQKPGPVSQSSLLGEPGPFVFDKALAEETFKKLSTYGTVTSQIAGVELAGIRPLADGSDLLKKFVVSEMSASAKGTLLIFVTHDAIVAPFIYQYTGEKFDKDNWIAFSDGAIITGDEKNAQMIRNGKAYAMR